MVNIPSDIKVLNNPKTKKILLDIERAYNKDYVKVIFIFFLIFSFFGAFYFSINKIYVLDDPFFLMRFAEIIREKGLDAFRDFPWLYFSDIFQNKIGYPYYNFLFFAALIPFTFIKPVILGIKLYGIVFFSLSFTILYYFLLKINIKKPFFWIIAALALTNYNTLIDFLFARSFTLAPAILILELYFLYRKKYWGVFLTSLIYIYWHNATFLFPLVVSVFFVAFENFYGKKVNWKLIAISAFGVIIAFVAIAVFFTPGLVYFFKTIFLIFRDTIVGNHVQIAEGFELYPVNLFDYLKSNLPMIALFLIAVVFEVRQYIQIRFKQESSLSYKFSDKQPLKGTLFFLSLSFFLGTLLTRRMLDFFAFFSIAYIALSFNDILKSVDFKDKLVKDSARISSYILCGYLLLSNGLFMQSQLAISAPHESIQGAARWINNNVPKKEIIFYPTWNWFSQLFYYDTDNYYIIGLEPRVLYDYNHELYWAWWNISTQGFLCLEEHCDVLAKQQQYYLRDEERRKKWYEMEGDAIAEYIKNNFHSHFILTSSDFQNLNAVMDNNSHFERVYADSVYREFYVYKIK